MQAISRLKVVWARFRNWQKQGKALWLFLFWSLLLTVMAGVSAWSYCFEFNRFLSAGLELVGAYYVIRQINSKRAHFGKKSLLRASIEWLGSARNIFKKTQVLSGGAVSMSVSRGSASGYVVRNAKSNNVFDRLDAAEGNIIELRNDLSQLQQLQSTATREFREKLASEANLRQSAISQVQEEIRHLNDSDTDLDYLGVVFVVFGVLVGNLGPLNYSFFGLCAT